MTPPFQSLSGFQVRCNSGGSGSLQDQRKGFQSLSGFQVRCNAGGCRNWTLLKKKFQSLSGFQVRCNIVQHGLIEISHSVSIPIGFSSSLQPKKYMIIANRATKFQSLSGFQVRCNSTTTSASLITTIKFQSLSGFQVRCNPEIGVSPVAIELGFNPYRVFKFVATV